MKIGNYSIPGIGMRIVKSAIAIAVCYLVNLLRGDDGIVFYSQLAALWCIQMYRSNTKNNAIQRTIGTGVGASYGLVYLLLYPKFINIGISQLVTEILLVSLLLLLVLYTTVLLNKKQTSYFSCVVFLSIAVNHVGDVAPHLFVWNRFLDTMIGIAIGIIINDVRICLNPDKETLFVSGLDDILLDQNEMLSSFSKVELNRMIDSGMKFTVSTMRTPASLIEPMRDVRLNLPVIAMDGAVLYDTNKHTYIHKIQIDEDLSKVLSEMISRSGLNWYANVITDDVLIIYYGDRNDDLNNAMVDKLKSSPYRNYIKSKNPQETDVVYYMLLDKTTRIQKFYDDLIKSTIANQLRINTYLSNDYNGYSYIKIYGKNANKDYMLSYLKGLTGLNKSITFGTIPNQYDVLVDKEDANDVVRIVRSKYEPLFLRR